MADLEFGIGGGTRSISLARGETITLRAAENPTTGFLWQPAAGGSPGTGGVALERLEFQQEQGAGVGAAGRRSFRLRAERPGTHRMVLELRRPWEGEPARATIELSVEVQ
jgi:predicted secreted protein